MAKRKVNPWAVCHKATGPKKDSKHERCVMQVKAKHGIKEVKMNKVYERIVELLKEGDSEPESWAKRLPFTPAERKRREGEKERRKKEFEAAVKRARSSPAP